MIEDQLSKLKKDLSNLESAKLQVGAKIKNLEEEKETLLKSAAALGVEPQKIEVEITNLEKQLEQEIIKVQVALGQVNVLTR
jgi:chromosome segregation ATPase